MLPATRPALLYSRSVEDVRVLRPWFTGLGITLISLHGPEPAETPILSRVCEFVLLDLDGEPDWRSTLRELRLWAPLTEVIVYTRRAETDIWIEALESGAFDLVSKPFLRREVETVVNTLRRRHPRTHATAA